MLDGYSILIIGILISIIFYELTDISPGGIIVPGIMVMYFNSIERIVYTLIIAFITYLIVKLLSKHILVFGKRRFVMMIVISIILNILVSLIMNALSVNLLSISIIGYQLGA